MSTKFLSPGWRMPRNANQSKITNYSLDFDGTDHVNAGRILSAENTSTLSVSFWLKIPSTGAKSYLGYFIGNFGAGWLVEADSSSMYFVVGDTSYQAFTLPYSGNIAINTWYHIVMVYDGNQTGSANILKVYINGTQKTLSGSPSFPSSIPTLSGAEFIIGGIKPTSVSGVKSISSVSIFDYALSQSQVTTLWGGGTEVSNPMALPSTPIAYYPLGGSAGAFRTPVNVNDQWLIENNAIGDYVFDFDGSSNFIDCGATVQQPTTNYSVSCWVKFDSPLVGNVGIVGNFKTGVDPQVGFALALSSGFNFQFWADGTQNANGGLVTGTSVANPSTWYNIVGTYDGSLVKIYVNNVLENSVSYSATPSVTDQNLVIGRWYGNYSDYYTAGSMSNVAVFNTALSGPEVTTLYNYGSPIQTLANIPQSSNLKAWYKLDATEIYNSTSTEWSVDNNQNPSAYPSSLDFNSASSAYINLGQPSNFTNIGSSDFTQSCWIYQNSFTSGTDWHGLIYIGARGSSQGHLFVKNNSGTPVIGCGIGDGATNSYGPSNETTYVVNNGQWYHIAYVKNSTSLKIYVNGNFVQSFSSTISPDPLNEDAYIGRGATVGYDEFFDGSISNASVWDAALTPAQVTEIYNNGTPFNLSSHSATSNLVSWWKLNNTTAGIEDSKGSNNGSNNGATEYAGFVNTLAGDSSGMSQSNLVQSDLQTVAPYSKYAMNFGGDGSYIDLNSDITLTGNKSVSFWVNFTSTIFAVVFGGDSSNYYPFIDSTNINIRAVGTTSSFAHGGLTAGIWYNVCIAGDGTNATAYLNGSSLGTQTDRGFTFKLINAEGAGFYGVNGKLSNCAIWNTALTASEAKEIYNEGRPSNLHNFSGTAPVAWWQLGENSSFNGNDWIVADEIGSNNGESNGMPVGALTNGVGTTANGTSTGMSESSLVGDAPYSTANAISNGMAATAIGTDVPPTP